MGRADIEVANRGVDGSSRPRRHCYPRGNFSVMPGPHQWGHERSLGRGFPSGPVVVRGPVRPAFALALYGGFLTRLSRPLGARVTFSRACRPSQTAHLTLSPGWSRGKSTGHGWVVFHGRLPSPRRGWFDASHLRYAPTPEGQRQAAVKLHGVFSPYGGLLDCAPARGFAGSQAGTVGTSLTRSCAPELTRQGIWLP